MYSQLSAARALLKKHAADIPAHYAIPKAVLMEQAAIMKKYIRDGEMRECMTFSESFARKKIARTLYIKSLSLLENILLWKMGMECRERIEQFRRECKSLNPNNPRRAVIERHIEALWDFINAVEHHRKYNPNQPRVPAGNPDGGQWTSEGGSDDNGDNAVAAVGAGAMVGTTPDGVSYNNKIQDDMQERNWTPEQIDYAKQYGDRIDALNRTNGEPFTLATRYVNPDTGASVVIDNTTNQVVQVGMPDFIHNVETGDAPGAVMRPSLNARSAIGPEGIGKPAGVEGGEGIPVHGGGMLGFPQKPSQGDMEE